MRLKERDWPFTLTLIVALTLILAMADRSCQWRPDEAPREHAISFE